MGQTKSTKKIWPGASSWAWRNYASSHGRQCRPRSRSKIQDTSLRKGPGFEQCCPPTNGNRPNNWGRSNTQPSSSLSNAYLPWPATLPTTPPTIAPPTTPTGLPSVRIAPATAPAPAPATVSSPRVAQPPTLANTSISATPLNTVRCTFMINSPVLLPFNSDAVVHTVRFPRLCIDSL